MGGQQLWGGQTHPGLWELSIGNSTLHAQPVLKTQVLARTDGMQKMRVERLPGCSSHCSILCLIPISFMHLQQATTWRITSLHSVLDRAEH